MNFKSQPYLLLLLMMLFVLAGCKSELYNDLSQQEANEMSAILVQRGITATRERGPDGQYALKVDEKHFAHSVEILSRLGYPKQSYQTYEDIFSGNRLVTSPLEERSRLAHAVSQELSESLTSIDTIVRARVHVVLPEVTPLGRSIGVPTASVIVAHAGSAQPQRLLPSIKNIVSSAVKGLNREDVSVSFHPVQSFAEQGNGAAQGTLAPRQGLSGNLSLLFGVLGIICLALLVLSKGLREQNSAHIARPMSLPENKKVG